MKAPKMKNTPSALKWLAEKRARIAGELASCGQVAELIDADLAALKRELANMHILREAAERRSERLTGELKAVDQTVKLYDNQINPAAIEAINAWQGTYGKRGALRNFLLSTLKSRAPEFVQTSELAVLVMVEFSLVFEHKELMNSWYASNFRVPLKEPASQGHIQRGHGLMNTDNTTGRWRWKQEVTPTLAELRNYAG